MRFSLHFHEFLTILSLPIFFFQNIRQYISNISDISVITDIFIIGYNYRLKVEKRNFPYLFNLIV